MIEAPLHFKEPVMSDGDTATKPAWPATNARIMEDALINLSHELRTPLSAAKGYTTSLLRHDHRLKRAERLAMLAEIDMACDRMEATIAQALHTLRVLQGDVAVQRQKVELAMLTRMALVNLERAHAAVSLPPCTVTLACDADDLVVEGDERLLAQTIMHLLDNACTYSPEGGTILVELRPTNGPDATRAVEWSVTDRGIGIAADHLERIFTPFYRTDNHLTRPATGLGLGLAFCQRVIALHGGVLRVASTPGAGSRFWFTLPSTE
jgi:two-component system phosphate regulon sensor histidine kinase PhoR